MRRLWMLAVLVLALVGTVIIAQADEPPVYLPTVSRAGAVADDSLFQGYIKSCDTTHLVTEVTTRVVSGQRLVYSDAPEGEPLGSSEQGRLRISSNGPVEGNWWLWLADADGQRTSEVVSLRTDGAPGLGKCQQAVVVFYGGEEDPWQDPCANIGGDGCKFRLTGGPRFGANAGEELKLQLFFIDSGVDGGQPQGSYYLALKKDGQLLPISDSIRSVALLRIEGLLGPYNYEYTLSLTDLPDGQVGGAYVGWVLDGNGERDSQNFSFSIPFDQGHVWLQLDQN
jgi:hypothetical protein